MNHQVLARKWRPHSFDAVVGQPHVVKALSNALNQQYLHHAYLFTGTRGVGKTTLARILAKCLNCEQGINANPCGECNNCTEIDAGRFIDLFEVDAASRTKVEDTRELLENVQYAPAKGRYKVYLIDEVHMLSGHSFNALLKTLEEPPPHVKFLLATTDPQRLPATVLSRCLQFHLTALPAELISTHLQKILQAENVECEAPAALLLAKAANGSVRDALSLLDQSIAFGNGKVIMTDVQTMLGTIEPKALYHILCALAEQDANALLKASQQLTEQGANFSQALADLLSLLHQITIMQVLPNAQNQDPQLTELASTLSPEDVQLYYQIALIGQRDLTLAPTMRTGFEMVLLRMLAFLPAQHSAPSNTIQKAKAPSATSSTAPIVSAATNDEWHKLLPKLNLTGATFALANECGLKELSDEKLHLILQPKHQPLLQKKHIDRIKEALKNTFGKDMQVTIDIAESQPASPAKTKQDKQQAKQNAAEKAINQDQLVQRMMDAFDATVVKESIAPVEQTTH